MTNRPTDDRGFTLVELLLVIAIMGVVIPAIAGAMLIYFRTAFSASVRTDRAHDANLSSAYWQPDLASATQATAVGAPCGNVLNLSWTQPHPLPNGDAGTPDAFAVTYAMTGSGNDFSLTRTLALNGVGQPSQVVIHGIAAACDTTFVVNGTLVTATVVQADASGSAEPSTLRLSGQLGSRT
jgi:prepilin-type N-terminal cleavage/methylation domain-containing protein